MLEAYSPDVVLLEVSAKLANGFQLAARIGQRLPTTAVIGISNHPDGNYILSALKAGIVAYLSKEVSPESLAKVIRRVSQGDYPINESILAKPDIASKLLSQFETYATNGDGMGHLPPRLPPEKFRF